MDVRMPDGTIVTNVPDNITQSELLSRYQSYQPPASGLESLTSTLEPTLNVALGFASRGAGLIGSGLEALQRIGDYATLKAVNAVPFTNFTPEQAAEVSRPQFVGRAADKAKAYSEGINYTPSTTLGDLGDNPIKVLPFIVERIITSTPDMAAAWFASPAYMTARANEILNDRLKNDEKELKDATVGDVGLAVTAAVIEGKAEQFGLGKLFKGKKLTGQNAASRIGKSTAIQAGIEGGQGIVTDVAGSVGTKRGIDTQQLGENLLENLIVGGGMGAGVKGTQEYLQSRNKPEADFTEPKTIIDPDTGIKRVYSYTPIDDPTLELGGTPEINGRKTYIYTERPLDTEAPPEVTPPVAPESQGLVAPSSEALNTEEMIAEFGGEQLPLTPPSAPVAQPAQIAQPEDVQGELPGEPAPAPVPAPVAQIAQPSAEDIVRLDDKGEPIKTPEAAPKEVLDPNIEAQLAAEPFDPDSIILPPKEEPSVRAPKAEKVKASEKILSAHEFIASLGGLDKQEASEINKDDAKPNVRIGNKWLYASKGGLSAAQAAEKLAEAGYIQTEDSNEVYRVINDSLVDPVYSINDADAIAERKFKEQALDDEERYQKRQAEAAIEAQDISAEVAAEQAVEASGLEDFRQQMLDAGYTEQDLNVIGFTKASPELQAEVAALEKQVSEAGLDASGILESLSRTYGDRLITKQEYYAKAKDELAKAIREKAVQGGGRDVSQADVQEGAAREEGLGQNKKRTIPKDNFTRNLASETDFLYREMSGEGFLDLFGGNQPFGAPIFMFAESKDMALGQGKNRGLVIQVDTKNLSGRPVFNKPALKQAYLDGMGEFEVKAQPNDIIKSIKSIDVSAAAFDGLTNGQKKNVNQILEDLKANGVEVNRLDADKGAALTSPTEKELKDKQEAAEKADAAQAKAERDAAAKEKADAERKEIAARSEKAAGEFVLGKSAEDDLSGQKDVFSSPVQISPEQQKIDALNKFEQKLLQPVPPFRAKSAGSTSVLRPKPLSAGQITLIKNLAGELIDLGMPASVLEQVSAAGATRMDSIAAMSANGWFILGKYWPSRSRAEQLQTIAHELGHSVDNTQVRGVIAGVSNSDAWQKAHDELKNWYDSSATKIEHPLTYPFSAKFNGKVRPKEESFAQAFSFYFVSSVDLQTNAPEAYSQIQSIVEGIKNESQRASTASATKTDAAGVKVQPSRARKSSEVQSDIGEVGAGVSKAERSKDRDDQGVDSRGTTATERPKLSEDIPNERWLQGKVDYAIEKGRNRYGVPHMSTVTGYFDKPVQVSLRVLSKLKGETDEQNNVRQASLDYIRKNWDEVSKSPPYIEVAYNGEAYVSEGNHRIMVAMEKGLESMPVEIRYFDGGQRKNGPLNPNRIPSLDSSVDEQISESRPPASKQPSQPNLPGIAGKPKGKTQIPKPLPGATWTNLPDMTRKDEVIIALVDKNYNLSRVQKTIEDQVGKIQDELNTYRKESLSHGRADSREKDFYAQEVLPIIKEMKAKNISDAEMTKYLVMRHAEEANDLIAKRNPNNQARQDNGVGYTYKQREDYFKSLDPERKKEFESIASKVDSILKQTRDILENNGIISAEERKAWEDLFEFYVPTRREESDFLMPSSGYRRVGDFAKSRVGSSREVVDVLSNIVINRLIAINRVEKERIARAFYGMNLMNPNPEYFMAVSPDAVKNKDALINELQDNFGMNQTEAEELVGYIMTEPTRKYYNKETGEVNTVTDVQEKYRDYVLPVKLNGKDRFVFANPKNPRAVQMIQSLRGLDVKQLTGLWAMSAPITRWFSAVNTQYNLIFGAWNFMRDIQGAQLKLTATDIADKKLEVLNGTFKALPEIYKALRERSKGNDFSDKSDGSWADFILHGGKVGYKDQFQNLKDSTNIVQKELDKLDRNNLTKATYKALDWISNVNDVMENSTRLSAYRAALNKYKAEHKGKITERDLENMKDRAADIAKNLTVNFNRKGTWGAKAGSLYAFFNASVQGTVNLAQTLRGPAGKLIMSGGIALGIAQALWLAMAGFDEDEPAEFIKQKNLIFPTGDGDYIMWPMPFGFNIFPNIGRLMVEGLIKTSKGKDTSDKLYDGITMLANSFNPLGGGGLWQMVTPTALDPLAALAENRDSFGRPISRESRGTSPKPGYTLSRDPSPSISQYLSEFINDISFGNKDKRGWVSPTADQLEYLGGQIAGGVGREIMRGGKFAMNLAEGKETPESQVPIKGKVVGSITSPQAISQRFYNNVKTMSEHEDAIQGRIDRRESTSQYMRDNPEASLWRRANRLENDISKLNSRRRDLVKKEAPYAEIKKIDDQKTRMMKQFNDDVKKREAAR